MRCATCEGKGVMKEDNVTFLNVCPECNGSGIGYCCEGDDNPIQPET